MSNAYEGMASAYAPGLAFGWTAFGCATAAVWAFPELLMPITAKKSGMLMQILSKYGKKVNYVNQGIFTGVPIRIFFMKTDTGKMLQGCARLQESAEAAEQAMEDVKAQLKTINEENWKGDDQRAFVEKAEKYTQRINETVALAKVTAALTAVLGTLIFIELTIAMAMSVALAALAVALGVALALGPFGLPAVGPIRTAGSVLAKALRTTVKVMDEAMNVIGTVFAGLVAAMTAASVAGEGIIGGGRAFNDLLQSSVNTLSDMVKKYVPTGAVDKGIADDFGTVNK